MPEAYTDFTLPEGVKLDTEVMGKFTATAKKLGLTQEQAQELAAIGGEMSVKHATALQDTLAAARTEWITAAKTDKEIGGEKFDENAAQAKAVFDAFGTPELKQLLIDSGLGDHPEMLRWAHRVSKHVSPDKILTGRQASEAKTPEKVMYG